jgi:glyoxylate/hydroxypyruvate reductase
MEGANMALEAEMTQGHQALRKKVVIRVDPERRQWWKETMSKLLPELDVVLWDEDKFRKEDISYAIVWAPPRGALASLPNLECVLSVGAGVAHITEDPSYPRKVPIIRTVGTALRQRMCEYVALHVLRIHRRLPEIEEAARAGEWKQFVEPVASNIVVGVMGVGNLGTAVGSTLRGLGYQVKGWSRRGRPVEGIKIYTRDQLPAFLEGVHILVSILPGTADTENVIDSRTISLLPKGAWVINVGRGSQVNESDLIAGLNSGHLAGAVLDVFRREPLPSDHPFWKHPKILITSHTASAIEPSVGGTIIAENLRAFMRGEKVSDVVDIEQGY